MRDTDDSRGARHNILKIVPTVCACAVVTLERGSFRERNELRMRSSHRPRWLKVGMVVERRLGRTPLMVSEVLTDWLLLLFYLNNPFIRYNKFQSRLEEKCVRNKLFTGRNNWSTQDTHTHSNWYLRHSIKVLVTLYAIGIPPAMMKLMYKGERII